MVQKFSSKRNIMILIFALAVALMLMYSVGLLATFLGLPQQHPQTATAEHIAFFPVFEPGTILGQVQTVFQVAASVWIIFDWISSMSC